MENGNNILMRMSHQIALAHFILFIIINCNNIIFISNFNEISKFYITDSTTWRPDQLKYHFHNNIPYAKILDYYNNPKQVISEQGVIDE